jgi:hypothetical protein
MPSRRTSAKFSAKSGASNRAELRELVTSNQPVGLLAYEAGEPVGWAALAPRPVYAQLRLAVPTRRVRRSRTAPIGRPIGAVRCCCYSGDPGILKVVN